MNTIIEFIASFFPATITKNVLLLGIGLAPTPDVDIEYDHQCDERMESFTSDILRKDRGFRFNVATAAYLSGIDHITSGSPLHVAAFCGENEVVKALIEEHGLDVDFHRPEDNKVPLRMAVEGVKNNPQALELVKYLVEDAGANFHAQDIRQEQAIDAAKGDIYEYLDPMMKFRKGHPNIWSREEEL